jgi:hypothetical protein
VWRKERIVSTLFAIVHVNNSFALQIDEDTDRTDVSVRHLVRVWRNRHTKCGVATSQKF